MGRPAHIPRPRSGWRRRALVLYWVFVATVLVALTLLVSAIEQGDRPIAFALVATGILVACAFGVVLVRRVLREA